MELTGFLAGFFLATAGMALAMAVLVKRKETERRQTETLIRTHLALQQVRTAARDRQVVLTVEDDGPGRTGRRRTARGGRDSCRVNHRIGGAF